MQILRFIQRISISASLIILAGCQTPLVQINERPMYEGMVKTPQQQQADKELIETVLEKCGSLEVASREAAKLGWQFYYQNDFSTAMKRFNQAWLLNSNNPEAFWGFGLIIGQRASRQEAENNLNESVRFLQRAMEIDPDNGRIMGDLAFSHTILAHYYKSVRRNEKEATAHFDVASKLFPVAYKADPEYPPIVANWSVFYFYTGNYQNAKKKADEAEKMGYKFSSAYIQDLKKKMK
ncbi:MAG: tetratricopeptide repeat protein [Kiritimatiellia bacterium]